MKKITIGLLVDTLENNFSIEICRGAKEAALTNNVQLDIFYGGFINENSQDYDYQQNNVFPIADSLDAIIISIASICRTNEKKEELLSLFHNIPIITLNDMYPQYSSVSFDAEDGLKEALEYMVNQLNKKEMIMIAGPKTNNGSNRRMKVFQEVLSQYGLLKDKNQIFHAPTFERTNEDVIEEFLQHVDNVDAIVCGNDELAIATYSVLKKKNIQIGSQVAVLGYDDIYEASKMQPPLASVKAPAYMLGFNAVLQALTQMESKTIEHVILPSSFIARESLGITSKQELWLEKDLTESFQNGDSFLVKWNIIENFLVSKYSKVLIENHYDPLKKVIQNISQLDFNQMDQDYYSSFMQYITDLLKNNGLVYIDFKKSYRAIKIFSRVYIQQFSFINEKKRAIAYEFYKKIDRLCIYTLDTVTLMKNKEYQNIQKQINLSSKELMLFSNKKECYNNILEALKSFHVTNGWLYLFDQPLNNVNMHYVGQRTIRLVGKIENGQSILKVREVLKVNQILKEQSFENGKPLAILSIYSKEDLYGYLVCDLNMQAESILEFLRIHISSALHTLQLFNNIERQSETDQLTYLYNRRGFYKNVYDFISLISEDQFAYIIYVDLDRLKQINDTYGHDEGDLAITKGANILKESFPINSIICRMGGDEFLVVYKSDSDDDFQCIENIIHEKTIEINQRIKREMDVSLSIGIKKMNLFHHFLLDDIINEADSIMYKNKIEKKKRNYQ